jgi:hypothetical protein
MRTKRPHVLGLTAECHASIALPPFPLWSGSTQTGSSRSARISRIYQREAPQSQQHSGNTAALEGCYGTIIRPIQEPRSASVQHNFVQIVLKVLGTTNSRIAKDAIKAYTLSSPHPHSIPCEGRTPHRPPHLNIQRWTLVSLNTRLRDKAVSVAAAWRATYLKSLMHTCSF